MTAVTKTLTIYNKSERGLSIDGDFVENTNISVQPLRSVNLNLIHVQFDPIFLDILADYKDRDFVKVFLDGSELTADDISSLKYGSSVLFGIIDGGHA